MIQFNEYAEMSEDRFHRVRSLEEYKAETNGTYDTRFDSILEGIFMISLSSIEYNQKVSIYPVIDGQEYSCAYIRPLSKNKKFKRAKPLKELDESLGPIHRYEDG